MNIRIVRGARACCKKQAPKFKEERWIIMVKFIYKSDNETEQMNNAVRLVERLLNRRLEGSGIKCSLVQTKPELAHANAK